ncbi:RNA polymerase sporulation sigma factor SigH [[Clostridium] polysaccharolyticum]|uniref:RNA polymerase sigma factor SigS n=1 Tax=[Clostridium] polysaccharolyticum TaxID=29364 RepID=A0A1H9YKM9_9FIRM|nr:RNA polymerase sporulation sigma factor SigH [[Clostridium] polysaccharolyticum]SES69552.1 RNA polymerase sporulation-specific sigma factor [[Clostridium] polysaccharolyticum]
MRGEKYSEMTDNEIIQCIRQKEHEAMEFLLEKYKHMVRKKANTLFLIGGDKDDLIQEGMIGLYKAIRDYNVTRNTNFYSFAELCISRQIYTAIKLSNRKKNKPLNDYVSFDTPLFGENEGDKIPLLDIFFANNRNPEELVIDKESTSMLQYELERRLSSFEQNVFALFSMGMDYKEIAKKLDRQPKSIDNAIQRIKSKLIEVLENNK